MSLVKVSQLFYVKYGINLELNILDECEADIGIPFVSRTANNNGISAYVLPLENTNPNPANTISVAGGGSVMESFLQKEPYYSGRDLFYLTPKEKMTDQEMLFYCTCLRANKYKYNYGRQANSTLKDLLIPNKSEIPEWVYTTQIDKPSNDSISSQETPILDINTWKSFNLNDLFKITSSSDDLMANYDFKDGNTPYITSTEFNNGISAFVDVEPSNEGNIISINRGGSVGEAFYQEKPFLATPVDVRLLKPRDSAKFNKYIGLFLTTILRQEKYRFNYSRKMGTDRLKQLSIKLPVDAQDKPDWNYMENYIKTLKYSASI